MLCTSSRSVATSRCALVASSSSEFTRTRELISHTLAHTTQSFGGELGWPNYGPNRLGRSVYGPYPFLLVQQGCLRFGVSRGGPAAAWWGGGVMCFVGVNLSYHWNLRIFCADVDMWTVRVNPISYLCL